MKKGLSRVIGTFLGGFIAWLGLIVCAGSYDENAEVNPYGLCAWLTVVTTLGGIFLSVGYGEMARMGSDYDHGFVGMYFTMTMLLIALEVFSGVGSRDPLVANRIVATLTGVAMAIVVSSIPPFVRGGNPKHAGNYLKAVDESFMMLFKTFSDADSYKELITDEFEANLKKEATEKGQDATYVLKDAGTLKDLPIYRVSDKLQPLIEGVAAIQSAIGMLHNFMASSELVEAGSGSTASCTRNRTKY